MAFPALATARNSTMATPVSKALRPLVVVIMLCAWAAMVLAMIMIVNIYFLLKAGGRNASLWTSLLTAVLFSPIMISLYSSCSIWRARSHRRVLFASIFLVYGWGTYFIALFGYGDDLLTRASPNASLALFVTTVVAEGWSVGLIVGAACIMHQARKACKAAEAARQAAQNQEEPTSWVEIELK